MLPSILVPLLAASSPAWSKDREPVNLPTPQPYALLQVWGTAWDFDEDAQADPAGYGDPEDDPGFKVRRARLGFEGEGPRLRYAVIFGTSAPYDAVLAEGSSGGTISVVDAYGGYAPVKDVWLTAGVQHVPISRDNLASSRDQTFQEEAVSTTWMTPGREAGLVADADFGAARIRLGAFNGNDSLISDDNLGKLVAARAEVKVGGKASAYKTYGTVEKPLVGYALDAFYDADVATSTLNVGSDVLVRVGGLAFLAEGRFATITPTATDVATPEVQDATKRLGAVAQLGYTVKTYEPAVRFSMFDDDLDVKDNGDVANTEIGLTWHGLDDHVRVGGGYVMRLELGGRSLPNDTVRLWMQMAL